MTRREEPIPALSAGLSHLVMTGLVVLAALPVFWSERPFQSGSASQARIRDVLSAPESVVRSAQSPAAPAAAPPAKEEWQPEEIVHAREQCMHLLSGIAADVEWLEPIKKGSCGLPAPVRLKSVGSDPKVVFDPPVDVNCRMVAALGKWVKSTLQPKARDRLKSQVVRIVGGSGYSCRNIYNLPDARLSQHALANAVDIGGFTLANGRTVGVLKGWGPTERDIKAKAEADAKAKAKASKTAVAQKGGDATDRDPARTGKPGRPALDGSVPDRPVPDRKVTQASLSPPSQKSLALQKKGALAALPAVAQPAEPAKPTSEAKFLRAIHDGACHEFGTVLGPEANDPHRSHFHLDLISRYGSGYCG